MFTPYRGRIVIILINYKIVYVFIQLCQVNYANRSEDMDRRKWMDS